MKKLFLLTAVVLFCFSSINGQEVYLSNTIGTWNDGEQTKLIPNCEFSVIFAMNNQGIKEGGFGMGFRIYCLDGSDFTPVTFDTLPINPLLPSWTEMFNFQIQILRLSCDGIGVDTVGILTAGLPDSPGLPVGFNEQVVKITTGGVASGETLCIDSSFVPTSTFWKWGTSGVVPSWDGPHCFLAEVVGVIPPFIQNPTDTVFIENCQGANYKFDSFSFHGGFIILNGPGNISADGNYTYDIVSDGGPTTVKIATWDYYTYCGGLVDSCEFVLAFAPGQSTVAGDVDHNCQLDISDLQEIVTYMFTTIIRPFDFDMADMNNDGQVDISDLLIIVDYMFSPPE